jgi:F-type H+-transporting ATPase subunit b
MPQLDPANFLSQIFWLLIVISLIFLTVKFIIYPNFERIFNLRINKISTDSSLAEKHRIEAEKINAECKKILGEAKERAQKTLDFAENYIKEKEFIENQKLTQEIKARFTEAEKEIELFHNLHGSDQLQELKLRISKIFVNNILEEEIEDDKLLQLIEEIEKNVKLRKN